MTSYAPPVLAAEISSAVERVVDTGSPRPRLRRELPVSMGEGRLDVAVIDAELRGFEVKSAADGLSRLDRQVALYNRVVDRAVLVVDRRHPQRLLERLPRWWGLWAASTDGGGCRIEVLRTARPNLLVQPLATAQLLWRDEAVTVLRDRGYTTGLAGANRWRLWTLLVEVLPLPDLRSVVLSTLRARREW